MNKDWWVVLDTVANEKSLPRECVLGSLAQALASAWRRELGEDADIVVSLGDGNMQAVRRWEVAADGVRLDNPARQMRLMDAQDEFGACNVGDCVERPLDAFPLTRTRARLVYQQLVQRVRDAERERGRDVWARRIGETVLATVKRVDRGQVHVDLGGVEAVISGEHLLPGERLRVGSRARVAVVGLNELSRGAPVLASRTSPSLLAGLLELEVPEIREGLVSVRAVARDAYGRSKVAVESHSARVDPVGACIGMRGVRIQAVSNELNGERIDLIVWSDNPAELAVRALAPAQAVTVVMDESKRRMDVAVLEEHVAMAVGRGGRHVRTAARLIGWELRVMGPEALESLMANEAAQSESLLQAALDVDAELAQALVAEGFTDLDAIAFSSSEALQIIDGLDENTARILGERARGVLLAQTLDEPGAGSVMARLSTDVRRQLADRGVKDDQALADCAAWELEDVDGLDPRQVGAIILDARAQVLGSADDSRDGAG